MNKTETELMGEIEKLHQELVDISHTANQRFAKFYVAFEGRPNLPDLARLAIYMAQLNRKVENFPEIKPMFEVRS